MLIHRTANVYNCTKEPFRVCSIEANARGVTDTTIFNTRLFIAARASFGVKNRDKFKVQEGKRSVHNSTGFKREKISVLVSTDSHVKIRIDKHQIIKASQQIIIINESINFNIVGCKCWFFFFLDLFCLIFRRRRERRFIQSPVVGSPFQALPGR